MEKEEKLISIEDELWSTRLLIFLEDEPQSNKYRQVYLNKEEFKNVSLKIGKVLLQEGEKQTVELNYSEELYTLPDLQEIHATK